MHKNLSVFFFTFLFFTFDGAFSQEKNVYSLSEAIDVALKNNPEVKISEKEIESAKGRRLQAFSPQQPYLSFSWEGIYSGQPLNRANTRLIGIEQNLEFPYKLFVRKSASNREIDISYENLSRTRVLISAQVKKVYYRVNYQQKLLEILESTVGLLRQFQEATLLKYQAGDLPYFEVIRAKVEIAKTQNEIIEAKKELVSAKKNFNLLLGKKGSDAFELRDEQSFVPFLKDKQETIQEFSQKSYTLKIAQITKEKEDKALDLAKMSFIPDLKFSGGFFSDRGEKFIPSFEIGFSFPLWWWSPRGQVQEKKANLKIAETRQVALDRIVKSEIEKAYELVKISEEQVLLFEKSILKEIDEELKAGINSYQYNQIDALSLLDIYRTNKAAKTEYYKALFSYLSGLADLEVAGEITQ